MGALGVDLLAGAWRVPVLFRVLAMGSAGRAEFGGPSDGRAGLGSAADMTTLWTLVPTSQVCAGGGD